MAFNENLNITLSNDKDYIYHLDLSSKTRVIRGKAAKCSVSFKDIKNALEYLPGNKEILESLSFPNEIKEELKLETIQVENQLNLILVRHLLDIRNIGIRKHIICASFQEQIMMDLITESRSYGSRAVKLIATEQFLSEMITKSPKKCLFDNNGIISKYLGVDVGILPSAPNKENKLGQDRYAIVNSGQFVGIYENTSIPLINK